MVPHVTTSLPRFPGEWAMLRQPKAILALCREIGYTAWRDRVLTPVTTMQLFRLQVLHGNTACRHLPHLSGLRFTAAAYCQARTKLPLPFLARLLERCGSAVQRSALGAGRWHGHRTFFVDGSGCSMPDTPALQDGFGQPTAQRPGCGFLVARLLGLFHAGTGLLLKLVVAPLLTHDLTHVQAVHPSSHPGDVLVADPGPVFVRPSRPPRPSRRGCRAARRRPTDCGLHAKSTVCHAGCAPHPGRQRQPALPVAHRSGAPGPTGRLIENEDLSFVACPGDLGGPARVLGPPRGALRRQHVGLPDPVDHPGYYTGRCGSLPCRRPR
jgi:hypothetical protein